MHAALRRRTWLLHVGQVAGRAEGIALVAVLVARMRVHLRQGFRVGSLGMAEDW